MNAYCASPFHHHTSLLLIAVLLQNCMYGALSAPCCNVQANPDDAMVQNQKLPETMCLLPQVVHAQTNNSGQDGSQQQLPPLPSQGNLAPDNPTPHLPQVPMANMSDLEPTHRQQQVLGNLVMPFRTFCLFSSSCHSPIHLITHPLTGLLY